MKTILAIITICSLFIVSSCGEENQIESDVTDANIEDSVEAQQDNKEVVENPSESAIWGVYEGFLGLYEQHVVMELILTGDQVSGNYFYAKHQKPLTISGTYDESSGLVSINESYKGKNTGYMEFTLAKGELNGYWMKKKGATEKESFKAQLMEVDKEDYKVKHERYQNKHTISVYNGVDGEDEFEVTDELKVNKVGADFFSFYYNVTGVNAHTGTVEGLGRMEDGIGVFEGEDACRLEFTFNKNFVDVDEAESCQYYRGMRAYFAGRLDKVK